MKKYELFIEDRFRMFAPLDDNDCCEILDFLSQQDGLNKKEQKERDSMQKRLERIAGGRRLSSQTCHRIDDEHKIWQVRSEKHRILWFYDEGFIIICISVFFKNTEGSPPPGEIERARKRKAEYFEAKRANQLKFVGEDDEE